MLTHSRVDMQSASCPSAHYDQKETPSAAVQATPIAHPPTGSIRIHVIRLASTNNGELARTQYTMADLVPPSHSELTKIASNDLCVHVFLGYIKQSPILFRPDKDEFFWINPGAEAVSYPIGISWRVAIDTMIRNNGRVEFYVRKKPRVESVVSPSASQDQLQDEDSHAHTHQTGGLPGSASSNDREGNSTTVDEPSVGQGRASSYGFGRDGTTSQEHQPSSSPLGNPQIDVAALRRLSVQMSYRRLLQLVGCKCHIQEPRRDSEGRKDSEGGGD